MALHAPCEQRTDPKNAAVIVWVSDEITHKPVRGAKVDLDPYGLEKLANEVGATCFGNLRIPQDLDECILVDVTVTKPGYGTFRDRNIFLANAFWRPVEAPLSLKPITRTRRRPNAAKCASAP